MIGLNVPDDPDAGWRDDAACLDHPAEWFTGPHEPGDTRRAIDVCNTCPVKRPCLEAALQIDVSADLGIWGGTTPTTRRRIRRGQTDLETVLAVPTPTSTPPVAASAPPPSGAPSELFEDEHGDHVDRSGRVIVFRIHGDPPYMLMIDERPTARTQTVEDAAALAATLLSRGRTQQ
jgi:WhiB family transcriptional regulator, redox-sensing transcriptional regulator